MTTTINCIPPSLLESIDKVPTDRPVVLLLRHAERKEFSAEDVGHDVPITQGGARDAHALGMLFKGRLKTLRTSPLLRCVQTAERLRDGSATELEIRNDRLLGDPGIFVTDPDLAWTNWQKMGNEGVMSHMATNECALPGMADPDQAARQLVRHMLEVAGKVPGMHVFVTHDVLLSATTARLLGATVSSPYPQFLEGGFFWTDATVLFAAYRSHLRAARI